MNSNAKEYVSVIFGSKFNGKCCDNPMMGEKLRGFNHLITPYYALRSPCFSALIGSNFYSKPLSLLQYFD